MNHFKSRLEDMNCLNLYLGFVSSKLMFLFKSSTLFHSCLETNIFFVKSKNIA